MVICKREIKKKNYLSSIHNIYALCKRRAVTFGEIVFFCSNLLDELIGVEKHILSCKTDNNNNKL